MIKVEHLDIRFGGGAQTVHAVRDVSFQVQAGESYGLVGESGSGKSTVLNALSGLLDNWQGRIEIAGEPQNLHRSKAFHKQVQMVFQDPYGSLHPRHTVDRALSEPVLIHKLGERDQRVEQALLAVGLDRRFRFRYPHQLSGGQRQRVAIARAMMLEPKILLLDEPTSALDVSVQAEILNMLNQLRGELNLTFILVSHNLAVIAQMCERLLVMRDGEALEELSVEQLAEKCPNHEYTRQLLRATEGYDRKFVTEITVDTN